MNVMTPMLHPGERSLPAELRTARGGNFAARRLRAGMRGVAGLHGGVNGLGDCAIMDDSGNCLDSTIPIDTTAPVDTSGGIDTSLLPLPGSGSPIIAPVVAPPQTIIPAYSAPTGVPTSVPAGTTPPPAPNGYQWIQAANNSALSLAKLIAVQNGGTIMQLPNGQQVIAGSPGANTLALGASGLSGSISTYLPYLLLAGVGLMVFSMSRR